MIVDASAIVSILKREDDADSIMGVIAAADAAQMTAMGYVEACIVADNPITKFDRPALDALLASLDVGILGITGEQARLAADAHTRFGRWSRSKAKLNFGDCFSYALAMERDEPLLFKGDDFRHTDVKKAF